MPKKVINNERMIIMPKIKAHSGSKKRFKVTKSGKVKYSRAYRRHILNKKSAKRKMKLRKGSYLFPADAKTVKKLIPYAS